MNKKKLFTAILTTAMLTLTSVASASEVASRTPDLQPSVSTVTTGAVQDYVDIRTKVIDETVYYPMDAILIGETTHTGSSAYTGKFTTAQGNGDQLNIWVKNNAKTTVYVTITRNGTAIHKDYPLERNDDKTFNMKQIKPAGGITGDWEVYVYNSDGSEYNLTVKARQF